MNKLASLITNVEKESDKKFTAKEKKFAIHLAATGNKAKSAREAGVSGEHSRQEGYRMAQDPKIQELVEKIQEYQTVNITEDLITQGILKEALNADAPRDRLNALQLLAKTKGMLKDVVESTDKTKTNEQLIEEIRQELGEEAAQKAKEELEG